MKTYITYNKGRDWRLLQAPDVDLRGSLAHCLLVSHPGSCGVRMAGWSPADLCQGLSSIRGLGGGLRNLAGAGQGFPTSPRALIYGRRLPFLLDGKFTSIPQTFTENIACAPTPSKMRKCTRESACVSGSQAELSCGNILVN